MNFWQIVGTLVAAVGGIGAIAAAVAAFVAKIFSDRSLENRKAELRQETERLKGELAKDTETHKLKLKKQELLFAKEMEAATDFFSLRRKLEPQYRHPDMDWDEALEDVIEDFADAEDRLQKFVAKHGPVLSDQNRTALEFCITIASNDKFTASGMGGGDMTEAKKAAESFLETLKKVEHQFVKELRA